MTIHFPDLNAYHPVDYVSGPLVVAKATAGYSLIDGQYSRNKRLCAEKKIPFVAYHFLWRGRVGDQVRHAISVVGKDVPLMLDFEPDGGPGVPQPQVEDAIEFVKAYRAAGGICRTVYVPKWYVGNTGAGWRGAADLRPLERLGCDFIQSWYDVPYSDTGVGFRPYGGITPAVWQYTESKPWNGAPGGVDFNGFPGTLPELLKLFGFRSTEKELTVADFEKLMNTDVVKNPSTQRDNPENPTRSKIEISINRALEVLLWNTDKLRDYLVPIKTQTDKIGALITEVKGLRAEVKALAAKVDAQ